MAEEKVDFDLGDDAYEGKTGVEYRFQHSPVLRNPRWMGTEEEGEGGGNDSEENDEGESEPVEKETLNVEDKVKLVADALGFGEGVSGSAKIFEIKNRGEDNEETNELIEVSGTTTEELIEIEWEYEYDGESDHETEEGGETGYKKPLYYFKLTVDDQEVISKPIEVGLPPEFVPST